MTGRSMPLVRSMVAKEWRPIWVEMGLERPAMAAMVLRLLLMEAVAAPMALVSSLLPGLAESNFR